MTRDYAQAMSWYRRAADQGFALAQNDVGDLYANGQGVTRDDAQALSWYRKAADQGNAAAQTNLGLFYANGRGGVAQDFAQAADWYRKAADQGDATAQNNLGDLYANGQGVRAGRRPGAGVVSQGGRPGLRAGRDQRRLFLRERPRRRAGLRAGGRLVSQGGRPGRCDRPEQSRPAHMNGQGVTRDYAQAMTLFRKAADQDNAAAQDNIGYLYANGHGVRRTTPRR